MAHTTTVTASLGPGKTVSAQVMTGITEFSLLPNSAVLRVRLASGQIIDYDVAGKTTITLTNTGGQYALSIA